MTTDAATPEAADTAAVGDAALDASDLDLIDDRLADDTKEAEEIWSEIRAGESGQSAPDDGDDAQRSRSDADNPLRPAPEPQADTATNDAPPAADIWANVPPELKAEYDRLAEANRRLEQQVKSDKGRVAAYQRRYEELIEAAKPRKNKERASSAKDIESLADDYPEIAEPLKKMASTIESRLDEIDQAEERRQVAAQRELEGHLDAQETLLKEHHPDWYDVLSQNGQAFAAWVEDQPRRIREAAARNSQAIVDAAEAATVIAAFKEHIGAAPAKEPAPKPAATAPDPNPPLNDRRARQLSATASPQRSGSRPAVSGIPEDGDPQAIWDALKQQEQMARRASD